MNLLDLILPARAAVDWNNPDVWTSSQSVGPSRVTNSGERVGPNQAMTLPVYFDCIRILAEDVAKLPLILYHQLERGKERAKDHPLYRLLRLAPCPDMTAFSFRETLQGHAASWGNGYAEIVRNGMGQIVALYPIHPSRMQVKRGAGGRIQYHVRADPGAGFAEVVVFQSEDIFHLHGVGGDGMVGYSVVAVAAESLGIGLAAQNFAATFFGNGMTAGGVLTHPKTLSETANKHLRESMQRMYSGAKNAHKPMILEEGATWNKTTIAPNEAQFLETRAFQLEEVCRWFRMPPHKVQHLARSTFSNIEAQNTEYVGDTLQPWLTRWEQEISRKLLSPEEQGDYFAEHLVNALLRGDHNSRANFYRTMVNIGAMTPNEVRETENLNPGDDALDDSYMQSNMLPVHLLGTQTTRQGAPTRAADDAQQDNPQQDDTAAEDAKQAAAQAQALRPAFVEAADRVLHREAAALARAAAKYDGNPTHFARWADAFYAEQATYLANALLPMVEALGNVTGSTHSRDVLADFALRHTARSKTVAVSTLGLAAAEENTPERLADEVIALVMETDHAPT